ncbi:MAG: RDD family protein [Candidatus Sulfotelmatobacter sp.]
MSNVDNLDPQSNPYVGLRPFFTEDSLHFFGREQQVADLLEILHQRRFLGVVGSSGSGKSSLVRAGLLPGLLGGFLSGDRDQWRIVVMRPGDAPICNLARALLAAKDTETPRDAPTAAQFEQAMRDDHTDAVVRFLTPWVENNANVFLLVDQFEEIFAFRGPSEEDSFETADLARRKERARRKAEAADFVDLLLSLADRREVPIYVALTMRTDFLGDCDLFYGLPEALNRGRYLVPRLTRQQLREAIEGPAKLMRQRIAPRLLDHLLNVLGDRFDRLPVLQHALLRTWDAWQRAGGVGPIDLQHFTAAGELEHALDMDAECAMQGLDVTATERIFRRLTDTDPSQRRVRSPARISQLSAVARTERSVVQGVVQRFEEDGRSFLHTSSDGNPDDPRVDISHESLIRQWNRLRNWVDQERGARDQYLELVSRARKHDRALLQGSELQSVLAWKSDVDPTAEWAERYAHASDDFDLAMNYVGQSVETQCQNLAEVELDRRWNKFWNPIIIFTLLLAVGLTVRRIDVHRVEEFRKKVEASSQEHTPVGAQALTKVESAVAGEKREAEKLTKDVEALAPPESRLVVADKTLGQGEHQSQKFWQAVAKFWQTAVQVVKRCLEFWYLGVFLLCYFGLQWTGKRIHRRLVFGAILDSFRATGGLVVVEVKPIPAVLPDAAAMHATSYAHTLRRIAGSLVDFELNLFLMLLILWPFLYLPDTGVYLWLATCLLINLLYETLQISSSWQATLGMRAVGIFRTDVHGERLSFGKASEWYAYRLLSILAFGLGFFSQPFTKKRQTFHDWMARTVVLLNPKDTVPVSPTNYASTMRRVGGALIDLETRLALVFLAWLPFGIAGVTNEYVILALYLVIDGLYFTLQIASDRQSTLGMSAAGIFRTDLNGRRLSFGKATKWYLCRLLSNVCFLGFLPQPFTRKKQTFHDWLAGSVVLLRPSIPSTHRDETLVADLQLTVRVPCPVSLNQRAKGFQHESHRI